MESIYAMNAGVNMTQAKKNRITDGMIDDLIVYGFSSLLFIAFSLGVAYFVTTLRGC